MAEKKTPVALRKRHKVWKGNLVHIWMIVDSLKEFGAKTGLGKIKEMKS